MSVLALLNQLVESTDEEPEKIIAAAIKTCFGKIYTGSCHIDAYSLLMDAEPEFLIDDTTVDEGFITSIYRFVTREEATDIAIKARQLRTCRPERNCWGRLKPEELASEDLPL